MLVDHKLSFPIIIIVLDLWDHRDLGSSKDLIALLQEVPETFILRGMVHGPKINEIGVLLLQFSF